MTRIPQISIPADLRPSDGRFGSGPSRIDPDFVADLAATTTSYLGTSHRRPGVQQVVASVREGTAQMYGLPDGYEVLLGLGGATAFWDAASFGLIEGRSAHFTCGEFSEKFAAVASGAPHLGDPVVVSAEPGRAPVPKTVSDVDLAAFIHNETSTGVLAPFARLGDPLVCVDGTSAAGALGYAIEDVDVYYFSPQKALGSEGGLWLSIMSPLGVERINSLAASDRWIPPFLSLKTALDNSRRNQTYNTPSLATLYFLDRQIRHVNDQGGIAWADRTCRESSDHLYDWAERSPFATPFVVQPELRSPTVVTIDFSDDVSAEQVAAILRENGIVDTESYRKLGRNQLRISTFPSTALSDIRALTASIDFVVEQM